jgi:uncharacterized protein (TIGR01777 family)
MRVLVSGAGGLVGQELIRELRAGRHEVVKLVRGTLGSGKVGDEGLAAIAWDPDRAQVRLGDLEGFDAVVHLAGEPILGRWNESKKTGIRESRIQGTDLLARSLAQLKDKPQVLLTASAIGIFGDTGDNEVGEDGAVPTRGQDFLADVVVDWEAASAPAREAGIRTVQSRFGVILSRHGGALAAMLLPFRLGLGGPVGGGKQWMSWVSNRDVARALVFLLDRTECEGAYNVVAPAPVTNRDFSVALGRALHRPVIFPVPAFAVHLLYGRECADATVLRSARVKPGRLLEAGFVFLDASVEQGLEWALRG